MNGFDIVAILIVLASALLAMARGFVREVLSIAALIAGALGVLWAFPVFQDGVRTAIEPGWLADLTTAAGIFLAIYVAVTLVTIQIHKAVHSVGPIGFLDRSAGFAFGLVRGFAILGMAVILLRAAAPSDLVPKWLTESRMFPVVSLSADALTVFAPKARDKAGELASEASKAGSAEAERRASSAREKDGSGSGVVTSASSATEPKSGANGQKGYGEEDRDNLDRLIGNQAEKK